VSPRNIAIRVGKVQRLPNSFSFAKQSRIGELPSVVLPAITLPTLTVVAGNKDEMTTTGNKTNRNLDAQLERVQPEGASKGALHAPVGRNASTPMASTPKAAAPEATTPEATTSKAVVPEAIAPKETPKERRRLSREQQQAEHDLVMARLMQ